MITQVKCVIHCDEDVVLLDISKEPARKNRNYCLECINEVQLKKTIQIKKIKEQTSQHCHEKTDEIREEYNPSINIISQTIKSLYTLKKKITCSFDEMIQKCEIQLNKLTKHMLQELECYENIFKDITRSKLELIGEILSGNHQRMPQKNDLQEESLILGGDIATIFNQLIQEEQDVISNIRQGLMNQINLISSEKDEEYWYAQAFNKDHQILAAGRGKDLLILQENSSETPEVNIQNGHAAIIYAIVIYTCFQILLKSSLDTKLQYFGQLNTVQGLHKQRNFISFATQDEINRDKFE